MFTWYPTYQLNAHGAVLALEFGAWNIDFNLPEVTNLKNSGTPRISKITPKLQDFPKLFLGKVFSQRLPVSNLNCILRSYLQKKIGKTWKVSRFTRRITAAWRTDRQRKFSVVKNLEGIRFASVGNWWGYYFEVRHVIVGSLWCLWRKDEKFGFFSSFYAARGFCFVTCDSFCWLACDKTTDGKVDQWPRRLGLGRKPLTSFSFWYWSDLAGPLEFKSITWPSGLMWSWLVHIWLATLKAICNSFPEIWC